MNFQVPVLFLALTGCSALGVLSPEAQNVLSAAGRIVEKTAPCVRSLLASEQAACDKSSNPELCKADAAQNFATTEADRDLVKGYLCEKGTQADRDVIAGEDPDACQP